MDIVSENFRFSYAVRYNKYFKDWSFVSLGAYSGAYLRDLPICTCVEGIRVENGTPGFMEYVIPGVSNSFGFGSPKTNVARSGLEISKESSGLFSKIYESLVGHISNEIIRMQSLPNVSFSRAVDEAYWVVRSLTGSNSSRVNNYGSFIGSLLDVPLILVDVGDSRKNISIHQFHNLEKFWTIE